MVNTAPSIHHWQAGDSMNAMRMNEIRDQIEWMQNPPMVHVGRRLTTQSFSGGTGVAVKVSFDTVFNSYDPYGFFNAGTPDQLTITVAGWYSCEITTSWAGTATDSRLIMYLYKNGTGANDVMLRHDQGSLPNGANTMRKESQLFFNVGDVIYMMAYADASFTPVLAASNDAECSQLRIRWVSN